ncbi:DUF5993 family protein [Bradyrhizobium elkanii]
MNSTGDAILAEPRASDNAASRRRERTRICHRLRADRIGRLGMDFTALFLAITIAMLVAWRGPRPVAIGLFAVILIACVATLLHHATDRLTLSF